MPLGAHPVSHADGSLASARALVIQDCRLGLRGKNDSVRPPGIDRPRDIGWRDDESRASHVLRNGPSQSRSMIQRCCPCAPVPPKRCRQEAWIANTWLAPLPRPAIRSAVVLQTWRADLVGCIGDPKTASTV